MIFLHKIKETTRKVNPEMQATWSTKHKAKTKHKTKTKQNTQHKKKIRNMSTKNPGIQN